jgi:hypothetical protein
MLVYDILKWTVICNYHLVKFVQSGLTVLFVEKAFFVLRVLVDVSGDSILVEE